MTAIAKKKPATIPREKVKRAVELALKGKPFDLYVQKSALGGMKVVRIVTPAWKRLRPAERISRVREAVERTLSPLEQRDILRFSVLTPDEYKNLIAIPHDGAAAKLAAAPKRMIRKAPALKGKAASAR
jgi:hypothetical protein